MSGKASTQLLADDSQALSTCAAPLLTDLLKFPKREHVPLAHQDSKPSSKRSWTQAETKLFYRSLGILGTDFSIAAELFENKDASQLLKKFKREQRANPEEVERALERAKRRHVTTLLELRARRKESQGSVEDEEVQIALKLKRNLT